MAQGGTLASKPSRHAVRDLSRLSRHRSVASPPRLADIEAGDYGLLEANGDKAAAGAGKLRYYGFRAECQPYVLDQEYETEDHGTLSEGDHAIDIEYLFLVNAPATKPRWYHSSSPPTIVTVPTHLVLLARHAMERAELPARPSAQQRQGVALGAVVLDDSGGPRGGHGRVGRAREINVRMGQRGRQISVWYRFMMS